MEFRHLLSFQTIARLKSFSKASNALFLSQPSVTSHLMELEKELDTKLLFRSKSTVELTETGKQFLCYVDQILALQEEARKSISDVKEGKRGNLKIALSGPDCYWLSPILEKFQKYYPNIELNLYIMWCNQMIDKVLSRELHFALIKYEEPVFIHEYLNCVAVDESDTLFVFSANHKFARYKELTLEDISNEPLIAYAKNTSFWEYQLIKMFHNAGLEPKIGIESSDHQAVKLLLQTSLGTAFLPAHCVKDEINAGTLITLPIKDHPPIKRYSVMLYRKDLVFNEVTRCFLNRMLRLAQEKKVPNQTSNNGLKPFYNFENDSKNICSI